MKHMPSAIIIYRKSDENGKEKGFKSSTKRIRP
jgi:hypothetical protein